MAKLDSSSLEVLAEESKLYIRYIASRIKDSNLAEDYFHDALLKASQSTKSPEDKEKLKPWFFSVLKNIIIDEYRKEATRKKHVDKVLEDIDPIVYDEKLSDICCDLEGFFLKLLSPQDEKIIRSLNLNGMSLSDYAQKHNISEGAARVRKSRAMKNLKKKVLKVCQCFNNTEVDTPKSDNCSCQAS